jgi:carboxyl-terminal processing protease
VWDKNVLYRYTIDFTDRNLEAMERITSIEMLDSLLDGANLVDEFIAYAERNGIQRDEAGISKSRKVIEAQIRAYIGRNCLTDESGFYSNIYAIDDAMQRAVKELKRSIKR